MIFQPKSEYDYDSIPTGYYDQVFHRGNGVQSKWHQLKFEYIRGFMGNYTNHLDIGCGPGTFIGTLSSESASMGVDISPVQIDYAVAHYGGRNKKFKTIDPGPLPFEDQSFDLVTLMEIVEHLNEIECQEMLREAIRTLKIGGRILITTPNYSSLWPLVEWLVNRMGEVSYEDQHITHFNRKKLAELINHSGLHCESVHSCLFVAPFLAAFNWRFPDAVSRIEPKFLTSNMGLSLLGIGCRTE